MKFCAPFKERIIIGPNPEGKRSASVESVHSADIRIKRSVLRPGSNSEVSAQNFCALNLGIKRIDAHHADLYELIKFPVDIPCWSYPAEITCIEDWEVSIFDIEINCSRLSISKIKKVKFIDNKKKNVWDRKFLCEEKALIYKARSLSL